MDLDCGTCVRSLWVRDREFLMELMADFKVITKLFKMGLVLSLQFCCGVLGDFPVGGLVVQDFADHGVEV